VGFQPTILASKRAKTVHALDRSATVTGKPTYTLRNILTTYETLNMFPPQRSIESVMLGHKLKLCHKSLSKSFILYIIYIINILSWEEYDLNNVCRPLSICRYPEFLDI
jgi:hypothetical protein